LEDRLYKSEEERLRVLAAIKENIRVVDWKDKFSDGISLLGGEIFYTDSEKVKESFLDLINQIVDNIFSQSNGSIISVVSNGIYDSNILLKPTLDLLKSRNVIDRINLNFSWDIKGRFHSEESLQSMIRNTNFVYDEYEIVPCVQTCLTQNLIDKHLNNEFNLFDYKDKHFPNSVLTFLYPHKINTGKVVSDFFFTRNSLFKFIKWLRDNNHETTLQSFIQSVVNSSQFKYTGLLYRGDVLEDGKDREKESLQEPTLEKKQVLTECGHSNLYRCYSDSDKCMLCDLLKVI
jgi:hypothetical protein